jgi:co-chaperonin GroES (HSP10)|tara:strand:+ start:181 stop:603 length:423 start_codon:yes stop_codon:yes gene_type:complete
MATLAKEQDNLRVMDIEEITFKDIEDGDNFASQLPEPKGYKLLIALPEIEEKTEGGIIKSAQTQYEENIATIVGWVMSMGPDAYANSTRFPSGPYCGVGEWVLFRAFSGTRIKIHGREFRIINDDTVEAVVQDPRGVERA